MILIVLIPFVVRSQDHACMVRAQSTILKHLQISLKEKGIQMFSMAVFDDLDTAHFDALNSEFTFKILPGQIHDAVHSITGIREPVSFGIELVKKMRLGKNVALLRIIQDTFICDCEAMAKELSELLASSDTVWLAGRMSRCNDVDTFMRELGLPLRGECEYVQGALMFAPFAVWEKCFLGLPKRIKHFSDDSVMSQMVKSSGGRLIWMNSNFDHRHDIDCLSLEELLKACGYKKTEQ